MRAGFEIASEALSAVIALRQVGDDPLLSGELLRRQVGEVIERAIAEARGRGWLAEEIDDLLYPIVALLDETALRRGGAVAGAWAADLLQVHYFRENVAGDGFFRRLDRLLAPPRGERWGELALVYFACLGLGFQGRYQMAGGEAELARIYERVAGELGLTGPGPALSPSGARPREGAMGRRGAVPLIGVAVVVLAAAAALVIGLHLQIAGDAARVAGELDGAAEEAR